MKKLLDMHGIITVLNTPFTQNGAVDLDSLCRNVRTAMSAGVNGFLVPAMASEVDKLTENERKQIVESVLNETKGQVTVIGGASASTADLRIRNTQIMIDLGCQGVLVSIPYENEYQYELQVHRIADLKPNFLMLQDWDLHGYGLPVPLIQKLFYEVEPFRCLKIEVAPAGFKYSQVLAATEGKLHVSGGWAVMQMIEALDRGVHAFMPTGMHEIYTRIYSLYKSGKRELSQKLFYRLLPVLAFSNQHLDISIHFFKRLLCQQGIYSTPMVREPIMDFDGYHHKIADKLILKVKELTDSILSSKDDSG